VWCLNWQQQPAPCPWSGNSTQDLTKCLLERPLGWPCHSYRNHSHIVRSGSLNCYQALERFWCSLNCVGYMLLVTKWH
jgi:hypothetical protein